jgi:hypothetical protein
VKPGKCRWVALALNPASELDGTLHITYNGQDLRFQEITKKPTKDTTETPLLLQEKKMDFSSRSSLEEALSI